MDPSVLCTAVDAVANACKLRGIVGYFSIDFVTFIDPQSVRFLPAYYNCKIVLIHDVLRIDGIKAMLRFVFRGKLPLRVLRAVIGYF